MTELQTKPPLTALLALATTAFLTILTETMPAAVLPQMASGLDKTPAAIGFLVSTYALASAAAAIPVVALTRKMPRKALFMILLAAFALCNAVTAFSTSYALTQVSRIGAGLAAGVAWPVVIGFAIRISNGKDVGRSVAITLAGSTVAMVAGLPLGSLLGTVFGWRATFAVLSAIALIIMVWGYLVIPRVGKDQQGADSSVRHIILLPGLRLILSATLFGILAHYTLYTYMAPLAEMLELPGGTTRGLLLFGAGAMFGIIAVGRYVDTWLRLLAIAAPLITAATLAILLVPSNALLNQVALFVWGLSFGGLPTIFQSAVAGVAKEGTAELATAMLTTVYNIGIFAGGAVGGLLITTTGLAPFVIVPIAATLVTALLAAKGSDTAFPR